MKNTIKPTKGDVTYSIVKAGLGSIPIAGAAASELLTLIVTPPLERRRNKWMEEMGKRLKTLEQEKGIDLEALRDNDLFIDTVLYASQLALRTSEQEKIEYLHNAIVNTAIGDTPDQSLTKMFLNFIDEFTIWHIRILTLFDNPEGWLKTHNITLQNYISAGLSTVLKEAYPELRDRMEFCNLVWSDLLRAGFHNSGSLQTMMTSRGLMESRTTEFGKQFLEYITQ